MLGLVLHDPPPTLLPSSTSSAAGWQSSLPVFAWVIAATFGGGALVGVPPAALCRVCVTDLCPCPARLSLAPFPFPPSPPCVLQLIVGLVAWIKSRKLIFIPNVL